VQCKQKEVHKILENVDMLVQVRESQTRGEVLRDLLFTSAEERIGEVKTGGSLGCSNHALMEFSILRGTGWAKSRVKHPKPLKGKLLHGIPWETALRDTGSNESWDILKDIFHRALEVLNPDIQEVWQGRQETSLVKSGPLSQTKTQNPNA